MAKKNTAKAAGKAETPKKPKKRKAAPKLAPTVLAQQVEALSPKKKAVFLRRAAELATQPKK